MLFGLQVLWQSNQFFFFNEVNVEKNRKHKWWPMSVSGHRTRPQPICSVEAGFGWPVSHPISHPVGRSGQWHISGLWASSLTLKIFVPIFSLLQWPGMTTKAWKNTCLGPHTMLAQGFSQAISDHLCLDTSKTTPTHITPCWIKGPLRWCWLPGLYSNWGSEHPPNSNTPSTIALIRISTVFLFPGIWPQTSARAQSPFPGKNHTTI